MPGERERVTRQGESHRGYDSGSFIPGARFRFLTPAYDSLCRALGLGEALRHFQVGLIADLAPRRILDVGCGTGELVAAVLARLPGASVTGIDPDEHALRLARRKLDGRALDARLLPGRAESLPFDDGSFDLVVSSLMLHHLGSATKLEALREWRRVIAPGGALLLVDFGVPRRRWLRALLWPLRFHILEEQADNFRGRVPGMLSQAGFAFEEAGVYRSVVIAYLGRRVLSRSHP